MRLLIHALLLLAALANIHAADHESKIAIGMNRDEAVALVKKHGAEDITPNLAIEGPRGEHPLTGIVWAFRDYDAILEIDLKDGKISRLTYWAKQDFEHSKSRRAEVAESIKTLTLDTKTGKVSVEKSGKLPP